MGGAKWMIDGKNRMTFQIPNTEQVKKMSIVVKAYERYFGRIDGNTQVSFKNLIGEYDHELVVVAIIETAETGASSNIMYILEKKLEHWIRSGITNLDGLVKNRHLTLQNIIDAS